MEQTDEKILREVNELTSRKDFFRARRLILNESNGKPEDLSLALRHKLALSTYKDTELPAEEALSQAWDILRLDGDPSKALDHETLSLAGSVSRRLWEIRRDIDLLRRSRECYARAMDVAPTIPLRWYSAVALASVMDMLGQVEENADAYREEACRLRQAVVAGELEHEDRLYGADQKDGWDWWPAAALTSAYFGLGEFDNAQRVLERSLPIKNPPDWHRETVARDIATLGTAHGFQSAPEARAALAVLADGGGFEELVVGKIGLALSGGGLRAALFHTGVLAKLAECGLLRHVEVLSCVSGGSILGALYYLLLKREFESRGNLQDYEYDNVVREVIGRLEKALFPRSMPFVHAYDFLWRKCIRNRAFVRAVWPWRVTVTTGRVLDEVFYAPICGPSQPLTKLRIIPKGEPDFHPGRHNWRRSSKVPVLIVNATTVNTGHNWQFTASWMGESPSCVEPGVDGTERLRRLYHNEAPEHLREIPLHIAVAASAAVPVIFPPIIIKGLYPERTVCLSDGGVHDNQGILGLLDQGCSAAIISDGCGQLHNEKAPSTGRWVILNRTNDILMDAGRRANYRILTAMKKSHRLRSLHFIHLKQGLKAPEVDWVNCERKCLNGIQSQHTLSPLNAEVQEALASIRTDLDSFSKEEIRTLMLAGYLLADQQLENFPLPLVRRTVTWPFLTISNAATGIPPTDYLAGLKAGRHKFGRLFGRIRVGLAALAGQFAR